MGLISLCVVPGKGESRKFPGGYCSLARISITPLDGKVQQLHFAGNSGLGRPQNFLCMRSGASRAKEGLFRLNGKGEKLGGDAKFGQTYSHCRENFEETVLGGF